MCITRLVSPIFGPVVKLFISCDRPRYKYGIIHFLSLDANIFDKNIQVFGYFYGNSKIAYLMNYIAAFSLTLLSTFFTSDKNKFFGKFITDSCKDPPNCTILDSWFFENYILTDKLFAKALQIFETCVSVNNNLCGKWVSSFESPTTFNERFKVTWRPFFISDFNLLSCDLDNFTFKISHFILILY